MTYTLLKIWEIAKCTLLLSVVKLFNWNSFFFVPPFIGSEGPNIRIRRGGHISLERVKARSGLRIFADGGRVHIAAGCFFNNNCSISAMNSIEIGSNTLFGEGVKIYDHNHVFDLENGVSPDRFTSSPVRIGKDCWIGSGVIILKGVTICDKVVVGAGSVVRRPITESGVYAAEGATRMMKIR